MKEIASWMLGIDRRAIFFLIGLVTLILLLNPIGLPVNPTPEVKGVYDYIESMPEGSVFLLSLDFDPSSKPELHPMAIALVRHAFRKNLRVIGMTLWLTGTGMADEIFTKIASEMKKSAGIDYVFLGFSPGGSAVILNMGQDLYTAFPQDHHGNRTKDLPVLKDVRNLKDIRYAVSLAAGNPGIEAWYVFGKDKYKFELGGGGTAVIVPGLYPLLQSGQINGLIGGLRGAAEYETLIQKKGKALAGMDAQSATHLVIIFLIILCNIFYLITGEKKKRGT